MKNQLGVCCFAGDPRSILMWSHYAKNHEGVCLIFRPSDDFVTFHRLVPVNYSSDFPIIDWIKSDREDRVQKELCNKSLHWSYEREQRLLLPDKANTVQAFDEDALYGIIYGARCPSSTRAAVQGHLEARASKGFPPLREFDARLARRSYLLGIFKTGTEPPTSWRPRERTLPPQKKLTDRILADVTPP